MMTQPVRGPVRRKYREIAAVFLKVGALGFGGPVATMALMEQETVRSRRWLTPDAFNEVYAICKILPGAVATQMAISLGRVRGGTWGGLLAGVLFVLPSFAMVLGLSVLYVETGAVQAAGPVLGGLQAGALAIILISTWGLGKPYRRMGLAWGIAAICAPVVFLRPGLEPLMILGFGGIGVIRAIRGSPSSAAGAVVLASGTLAWSKRAAAASVLGQALSWPASPDVLLQLFWMCCKGALFVFGTGLAIVPVLEADAVARFGWLTHSQFMDGLAIGQITPGPVLITTTFIGYMAAKVPGAVAATAGIFLPAFFNVLVLVPRVWSRVGGTAAAKGFSLFAIPAVIGGILGATVKLGTLSLTDWKAVTIFVASLAGGAFLRLPAWALIPAAGLLGFLL